MLLNSREMGRRYVLHFIFFVFFLLVPSVVLADIRAFVPKVYSINAELEVDVSARTRKTEVDGKSADSSTISAVEKLRFRTIGFAYNPKFIQYQLGIGIGLRQQQFTSSSGDRKTLRGNADDYELLLSVLPTHPYRLLLFTRRSETNTDLSGGASQSLATTSTGGIFTYKDKTKTEFYDFRARVIRDTTEYASQTTELMTYGADGGYRKVFSPDRSVTFNASLLRQDGNSYFNTKSTWDSYELSNTILYDKVNLGSSVNYSTSDQSLYSAEASGWREILFALLPWNFDATLSQDINKKTQKYQDTEDKETDKRWDFNLRHKLYESLNTVYLMSYQTTDSSRKKSYGEDNGDSSIWSNSLDFNYSKIIPYGYLYSDIGIGKSENENNGTVLVVNEAHPSVDVTLAGGTFNLNLQDVDTGTIGVRLQSAQFGDLTLIKDVNFRVTTLGKNVEITVFSLPDPPFPVPGVYDFYVSYSLLSRLDKTELTSFNYDLRFRLFDGMITPYYTFLKQKLKVISGQMESNESTTNTIGLLFIKSPYQARGEYSENESNNPFKRWRADASYSRRVGTNSDLYAQAQYTHTSFGKPADAESILGESISSENNAFGNISFKKNFPSWNMYLSVGGGYSRTWNSETTSNAYSLNSNFQWFLGRTIIRLGASLSSATSDGMGFTRKENNNYYYLRINRALL